MVPRNEETLSVRRNGETVETKLLRIADKARRERDLRFTSLFHLMNEDYLRERYAALRKDAAAGVDGQTKEEYEVNCEENITSLVAKLHKMAYRPQPVRRVYIPKVGSHKKRLLQPVNISQQ